jgi:hypothetical protein
MHFVESIRGDGNTDQKGSNLKKKEREKGLVQDTTEKHRANL